MGWVLDCLKLKLMLAIVMDTGLGLTGSSIMYPGLGINNYLFINTDSLAITQLGLKTVIYRQAASLKVRQFSINMFCERRPSLPVHR